MFLPIIDIIIDVETIGIFGMKDRTKMLINDAVFNVGIVLAHNGKILLQDNVGIEEFWLYPEHRILDFYRKNFQEEDFTVSYPTMLVFLEDYFYPLLRSFNKNAKIRIWSYNAGFDRRAIVNTALLENHKVPKAILNNWRCLMVGSSTLLRENFKFLNWLVEKEHLYLNNEYISKKGNLRIKAETVYRYVTQNPEFKEEHKGMQDAQIELEILQWIKSNKNWSKINMAPEGGSWQILNDLARPFQKRGQIGGLFKSKKIDLLTITNINKVKYMVDTGHISRGEEICLE